MLNPVKQRKKRSRRGNVPLIYNWPTNENDELHIPYVIDESS